MTLLSGQTSSTQARQASIDDLVTEVRALRADIQQMADASIRRSFWSRACRLRGDALLQAREHVAIERRMLPPCGR